MQDCVIIIYYVSIESYLVDVRGFNTVYVYVIRAHFSNLINSGDGIAMKSHTSKLGISEQTDSYYVEIIKPSPTYIHTYIYTIRQYPSTSLNTTPTVN